MDGRVLESAIYSQCVANPSAIRLDSQPHLRLPCLSCLELGNLAELTSLLVNFVHVLPGWVSEWLAGRGFQLLRKVDIIVRDLGDKFKTHGCAGSDGCYRKARNTCVKDYGSQDQQEVPEVSSEGQAKFFSRGRIWEGKDTIL